MAGMELLLLSLHILYFSSRIYAFNLDTSVPIIKAGIPGSYFGFSVAQHQITDKRTGVVTDNRLLVGAPIQNVTVNDRRNPGRQEQRGAIYSCPLTSYSGDCEALLPDLPFDERREIQDNQWLGVTVRSGAPGGKALACAHRHVSLIRVPKKRYGDGICYTLTNLLDWDDEYDPCDGLDKTSGHNSFGFCQAGTGGTISEDEEVVLGGPGAINWRGAVWRNTIKDGLDIDRIWVKSRVENVPEGTNIPPPAVPNYAYLGMAVDSGRILGGRMTYAAGAPRYNDRGAVLLFRHFDGTFMKTEEIIEGKQVMSSFGYDVLVEDVNNDRLPDLIVGAPFYHDRKNKIGGAIYIYLNSPRGINNDTEYQVITNRKMSVKECKQLNCEHARFGYALSRAGDINQDGFKDIVVGAPYEGTGVVYVFHGSAEGIVPEYAQRVEGTEISTTAPLSAFGSSLSGGRDMDGNGYPDLLVGSYDSSHTILLRTRPIVRVFSRVTSNPRDIDPNSKVCRDGQPYNCFEVELCFKFTAKPTSAFNERITITYNLEAEKFTGKRVSRVFFNTYKFNRDKSHITDGNLRLFRQAEDRERCVSERAYIKSSTTDYLNPINFKLSYALQVQPAPVMNPGDALPNINEYPILDETQSSTNFKVDFKKNCGKDKVCHSDLKVTGKFQLETDRSGVAVLSLGEVKELKLDITVTNKKEDAHEAMLTVHMSDDSLQYIGVDAIGKQYSCQPIGNNVTCLMGNPLRANSTARFTMRLDPKNIKTSQSRHFNLRVNTTSQEVNSQDDYSYIRLQIVVKTDMLIRGSEAADPVFYGGEPRGESAIKYEDEIGNNIVQSYEIKNQGPGKVANSTVFINWPYEVENGSPKGKHLLYLIEEPQIDSPGKCIMQTGQVNPLNIRPRPVAPSSVNVIEGSSEQVGYENVRNKRSLRVKRENIIRATTVREGGKNLKVVIMDCDLGTAKCFKFRCTIGQMMGGDSVVIKIRARLWNSTFVEDYRDVDRVEVYSKAELVIDPSLNIQQDDKSNDAAKAVTVAVADVKIIEKEEVPLWIIILAVIGGLLLLCILVIVLWKLGFFKRRKVEEMEEHEAKFEKKKYYDDGSDI